MATGRIAGPDPAEAAAVIFNFIPRYDKKF
jgi:hypothetical protein